MLLILVNYAYLAQMKNNHHQSLILSYLIDVQLRSSGLNIVL